MRVLILAFALCASSLALVASTPPPPEPAEAPAEPQAFVVDGQTYRVLDATESGWRVSTPDARVIGIQADPAVPLTAEILAAALANPPAPVAPAPVWTALVFFERFTEAEQLAIFGSEDAAVRLFRAKMLAAQEVRADDPRTAAGLDLLVAKGLLTPARKAAILAAP